MTYNRLEDTVKKVYLGIDVKDIRKLDAELIASRLGFSIVLINGISKYIDSHKTFYINRNLTQSEKWQCFGHELCHALWHAGNQMNMHIDWRLFQEWQAKSFAYEACIPRFLLEKELAENPLIHPVALIVEKFGVTYQFAEKRYTIHCNRKSQYQRELFHACGL